jgi:hypothetical protein
MYCIDLKQILDENFTEEEQEKIKPEQFNEHNALADAEWNLKLFREINKNKMKLKLKK